MSRNAGGSQGNPEDEDRRATSGKQFSAIQQKLKQGDGDFKSYAGEIKAKIAKQHTTIDNLRNKNNALKEKIVKNNEDYAGGHQFLTATDGFGFQAVDYEKLYLDEEERAKMNENRIKTIQQNIVDKKREIGGVNAGLENQNSLVKQIKILENRLDKANQKFNEAISVNKSLRQSIDSLRRERVIFDK